MKIGVMIGRFQQIATQASTDRLKSAVAEEGLRLITRGFSTKTDPYGRSWKERKDNLRHPILRKSGALKNSWTAYLITGGVRLLSSLPYSAAQNYGYAPNNLVARAMVPSQALGIGAAWTIAIAKKFKNHIKAELLR